MRIEYGQGIKLTGTEFRSLFAVTWVFVLLGSLAGIALLLAAGIFDQKSLLNQLCQKTALFTFFAFTLGGYTAVCITSQKGGSEGIKASLRATAGRSFLTIGLIFAAAILFAAVILLQTGISMVSLIPFAGPALIALLTAPLFIFNLIFAATVLCFFAVLPPLVSRHSNLKEILYAFYGLMKKNWINIILYLVLSLCLFVLAAVGISLLVNFTAGVTKALQWKINAAYSPTLNAVSGTGLFTRIITDLTPGADPVSAFKQYGSDLINYLRILKYAIGISYIAVFTLIISFPLSLYFYISSIFFKNIIEEKN